MVPSSRRATRVVTCWFVFVADAIAGNLRAGARLRGRSDREGTRTRNLYFPRSSTLEDYVLACETSLRGSQIDQHEFAAFVVGYCRASNSKGKGCPLEEVPFSSLPLELQLSFVDCPGSTTYAQIDCLRHLVETSDSLVHNGAAGALCARTFPLMKSIGFLHSEVLENDEPWSILSTKLDTPFSTLAYKGPASEVSTKVAKAAKKKSEHWNTSSPAHQPPSATPSTSSPSATPKAFFEEPILSSTQSPTETPVLQIVQGPLNSEQQSQENYTTQESTYKLHPLLFIGVAAAFSLFIVAFVSRGIKRKRRGLGVVLRNLNEDPALSGDASISSEPSHIFNVRQDEDKQENNESRISLSSFALFRFFQKTQKLSMDDPLEACRATSHFQRTTHALNSLESASECIKKRKLSGSATSTAKLGIAPLCSSHHEEKSMVQHDSSDLLQSTEHATHSSDSDCDESGPDHGYFLDVAAIDAAPESTLTDSSEDEKPREQSTTRPCARRRFLFGGKLASGLKKVGSFRSVSSSESQSVASFNNRETLHEDEALEDMECSRSFQNNGKPWRNALAIASGDASCGDVNTDDKVEEGLSFLSPDVLKQFEEVDQRLSDGLKQVQEEDQKLSDEMDRITASMSNNTSSPNKVEQEDDDYDDGFSHSSCNEWDGDVRSVSDGMGALGPRKGNDAPMHTVVTTPSTVASTLNLDADEESGNEETKLIRVRNLRNRLSSDEEQVDEGSSDDDDRLAFGRLRDHFESKWKRPGGYSGLWEKPVLQQSPPESKREALIAATSSSLLHGVMSEDDE